MFSFRQLKPPAATVGASLDSAALAASLGGTLYLWTTPPVVVGGKARSEQQVLHQQQMEQLTMSHKKILAQVLAQHQTTTTTMTNNNNININIGRAS